MHQVYHTPAVVIKSIPVGEANKRIWIFTKEFGYIMAVMQGVRKSTAKLSAHSIDYSLISADLVRGKSVWRLINAKTIAMPLSGKTQHPYARGYVRTLAAIDRFCVGEEADTALFDHLESCSAIVQQSSVSEELFGGYFDTLSLWRLLVLLGHVAIVSGDEYLAQMPLIDALSCMDEKINKRLIADVNSAITQSHL